MSTQYSFSQQVNDAYQLQTYLTGAIGSISYINYSPDSGTVSVYTTASLTSGQASSLTAAMSAYQNPVVVPVVTSSFSLAYSTLSGSALSIGGPYASISGFLSVGTDLQVNRNLMTAGTATGTALNVTGPYASISGFLTVGTDLQVNRNLITTGTVTGTSLSITGPYASISGSASIGTNLVVSGTGTIAQTLNTGPLTVNQSTVQNTLTIDCRSSQSQPGTMIFANTAGTGDLKITSDGGDIQWEGGGGRVLQMGAYHGVALLGGRVTTAAIPQVNGSGSLYNTTVQNTNDSIALIVQGIVGQASDLQRWQDASGNIFGRLSTTGLLSAPAFAGSVVTLTPRSVSALPTNPAATLYIDPADNVMKTINSAGRVTTYSPETTKGDITVYNGTTQVRQAIGTNESTLIADSTQAAGVRWSPAFGSEFQNINDTTSAQTTGTTFLTKTTTTLTTTSLVGGNYMVGVRYTYKVSSYIYNVEVRALLDSTVWHDNVTTSVSSKSSIVVSDWAVLNLAAGVHTLTMQYRVVDSGVTVTVPTSGFYIYRAEQI